MSWSWFLETLVGCGHMMFQILMIAIPLMIFVEFCKYWNIMEKCAPVFRPIMGFMGLPKEAVLPILAGLFFGLLYGAGVILQYAADGALQKKDMIGIAIFLVCCHSLFEDNMLFFTVGANVPLILGIRLVLAIFLTAFWFCFWGRNYKETTCNHEKEEIV